jgi:hypothetical protein
MRYVLEYILRDKRLMFIICILLICSIAIAVAVYSVVTNQRIRVTPEERQARELEELRNNFRNIFTNTLYINNNYEDLSPNIDFDMLMETAYALREVQAGRYDFNINIPRINLEHENIEEINELIRETYLRRAAEIHRTATVNTVFNVDYVAFVNGNVLSVVIRATLLANPPQRFMVQTFNVDLDTLEILTIQDIIELKNLVPVDMQEIIDEEIAERVRQVEAIESSRT